MQIAERAGSDLFGLNGEQGLGRVAGAEEMAVCLAVGNHLDPLDVVIVLHRMGNGANLHLDTPLDLFDHRHVLLLCGIGGILGEEIHRLAAADQRTAAGVDHLHHIAANTALVDLQVRNSHGSDSFL